MKAKYPNRLEIDGAQYRVEVLRKVSEPPDAPRLIMAAYHHNEVAARITQVATRTICRYTDRPFELWIVDNASPRPYSRWLVDEPGVNVVFNRTEPSRLVQTSVIRRTASRLLKHHSQLNDGSYANGVGFEIAARLVDPDTRFLCALHMDILACKHGWLDYLIGKLSDPVRGVAVASHNTRLGKRAMSASGFVFDFTLFRSLNMHFLPNMPHWDASELVTIRLEEAGYRWMVTNNTFDNPELIERIPADNPLRTLHSDRSFDDAGDVFFMHLGRGTQKAAGRYDKPGRTYPEQWIAYAEEHLLS